MAGLIIVRPTKLDSVTGTFTGSARVATPDPKEIAVSPANGQQTIDIVLSEARSVDTIFIGFTSFNTNDQFNVSSGVNGMDETARGVVTIAHSDDPTARKSGIMRAAAPFTAKYFRIRFGTVTNSFVGVVALGLAFQPQWGHEYGSGRTIEDTGSAERLFGGGFGIDEGVAAGGYQWTFGDLQPLELRQLYQLVKDRRTTRSVLVVEDSDLTEGLNERIHWSLFDRLDAYERIDPLNSRWSLKIRDWA